MDSGRGIGHFLGRMYNFFGIKKEVNNLVIDTPFATTASNFIVRAAGTEIFKVQGTAPSSTIVLDSSFLYIGRLYFGAYGGTLPSIYPSSQFNIDYIANATTIPDLQDVHRFFCNNNITKTGGTYSTVGGIGSGHTFAPTSGSSRYVGVRDHSLIAQTSTATGVTAGLGVDTTITTAYDFRQIDCPAFTYNFLGTATMALAVSGAKFGSATMAASGTKTVTRATTLYVDPPIQGTNVTITNLDTITSNGIISTLAGTSTAYARVGGTISDFYTDVGNGTTVETDLNSYTSPANILSRDGDKISAFYSMSILGSATETSKIQVYFAGTSRFDSGTLSLAVTGN